MCILCVIQKWSRRIATMLPWLVIPLIGLWALSQLLPPAFHFEITSPRLACVLVLLITLFWYEVLMPQLSAWQTRRNARLRERMRCEAIELQKLRKTATRRCRNCLTPYRDQNPGGGKFMCSCCGHISKRPVLDLPVPPGIGGGSGILRDVVGKGGKLLNGKQRLENGWFCGQDWMENANRAGGSFSGNSSSWNLNGGWLYGGDDDQCMENTSYSRAFVFVCKVFSTCILSVMWLWRRIFGISSSREDASVDAERRGILDNRSENGANGQESRGDKARRKAEEKRQARLEKELLEEEERKQREEVARLVEERRRLRDVKIEAEKERGKGSPRAKEKDSRKESEKKRQERKKDRERGLSKSDVDTEELEKRVGKENDRNKNRETQKIAPENIKAHGNEQGHGFKVAGSGSYNHGYSGARYFDRMRGTILSSSRVLTGGSFFGKSSNTPSVTREHKPAAMDDNTHTSGYRKDMMQPEWISGSTAAGGGDKNVKHLHVIKEPQPCTPAPKKSWQQLFTLSAAAVTPPSNSSVISRPIGKNQVESQEPPVSGVPTSTQLFNNPFSLPSFPFITTSSNTSPLLSSQSAHQKFGDPPHRFFTEESEIFEDPCYDPDPISLLGPVSESLDNFQLDLGFLNDAGLDKPRAVKTIAPPSEVSRPSSIGSPLSRSRPSEDMFSGSFLFPSTPKAHDYSNNVTDNATRPMWSTLSPDSHGIVGGPGWLVPPPELNLTKDNAVHSVQPHKTMASLFKKDGQAYANAHAAQNTAFGNCQNDGTYKTSMQPDGVKVSWLPQPTLFASSGPENQSMLRRKEEAVQNGFVYQNSGTSATSHQFELSGVNSWVKQDGAVHGSRDVSGNSPINNRGHVGGLYSPPDVQPFWSYD